VKNAPVHHHLDCESIHPDRLHHDLHQMLANYLLFSILMVFVFLFLSCGTTMSWHEFCYSWLTTRCSLLLPVFSMLYFLCWMTSFCSLPYLVAIMPSSTCSSSPTSGSKPSCCSHGLLHQLDDFMLLALLPGQHHVPPLQAGLLLAVHPLHGLLHALLPLDWSLPLMTVVPLWSLFALEMLAPLPGHHHALLPNYWLTTSCSLHYLILIMLSTLCASSLLVYMWMACLR